MTRSGRKSSGAMKPSPPGAFLRESGGSSSNGSNRRSGGGRQRSGGAHQPGRPPMPPPMPPPMHALGMQHPAMHPMMPMGPALPAEGSWLGGVVKKYDPVKKFGFAVAQGVPLDFYFKSEEPFTQGQHVAFTMHWSPDGKPQAHKICIALAEDETVSGVVKSFSERNGYGFIKPDSSEQDIYFKTRDLPEEFRSVTSSEIIGTAVECTINLQEDGRPIGKYIVVLGDGGHGAKREAEHPPAPGPSKKQRTAAPAPEPDIAEDGPQAGDYLAGTVKSYNLGKGFGFISCEVVPQDIYFRKVSLPEEVRGSKDIVGQNVRFILMYTQEGKPQATDMEVDLFTV